MCKIIKEIPVNESDASSYNNYEAHIVATLMAGFVTGTGPENYNFPLNPQAFFFKIMRDEISRLTGQKIMIFQ